jgi:aspartate carbamoyltransferase catalytic subunit
MYEPVLPGPVQARSRREHVAADPANVAHLKQAIPDEQGLLSQLAGKHLISPRHLSPELMLQLFRIACRFELGEFADRRPLTGRILSNVFLDRSRSHTRLSFNSAWVRLGGTPLNFERSINQVTRTRHAPDEIAELCNNYGDMAVLRTLDAATFSDLLDHFQVPVINAGNGNDQHPTHALADLYTLFKWQPSLMGLHGEVEHPIQVAIFGNPSQTRTIRSFLESLAKFPRAVQRVVVFERLGRLFTEGQREDLEEAGLKIETVAESLPLDPRTKAVRKLLPHMDMVYIHHTRPVNATRMDLVESIAHLKPNGLVLNPQINSNDFAQRVNNSSNNGYFAQARGAVFVLMALFSAIMGTRCTTELG